MKTSTSAAEGAAAMEAASTPVTAAPAAAEPAAPMEAATVTTSVAAAMTAPVAATGKGIGSEGRR